jgi:hypothetical protein
MGAVLDGRSDRRRRRRPPRDDVVVDDEGATWEGGTTTTTKMSRSTTTSTMTTTDGLTLSDLYAVPRNMRSAVLARAFEGAYRSSSSPSSSSTSSSLSTSPSSPSKSKSKSSSSPTSRRHRRLIRAQWTVASPSFLPTGFCELVVVGCGIAMPLLIRGLIRAVEDDTGRSYVLRREGMPYAISIFVASVLNAPANHRHRHLATKAGASMRGALIYAIYRRSLTLTPGGRIGLTSGEAMNLIAVDAQKLYEVRQEGHLIWALPLSVLLVGSFLCEMVGPSALSGIAVLIGSMSIIVRVTAAMTRIRNCRVALVNERVELVSSMLRGMRVTKLNNREEWFLRRVTEVQDAKLACLSREMAVWARSPLLATAVCFTAYVLIDGGGSNVLKTSDAFGVLARERILSKIRGKSKTIKIQWLNSK